MKTITLTFPLLGNLDSLLPQKVMISTDNLNNMSNSITNNNTLGDDNLKENAAVINKIVSLSALNAICEDECPPKTTCAPTTRTTCTTVRTTCSTTTPGCPPHAAVNFKELNQTNKIISDLSNYVVSLLQPANILNASILDEDNLQKEALVIPDSYNGRAIIPVSLRKIIKLKHDIAKNAGNNSDDPQDIFIVQLLKDRPDVKVKKE